VELLNVKLAVRIVTAGLHRVNMSHCYLKEHRNVTC